MRFAGISIAMAVSGFSQGYAETLYCTSADVAVSAQTPEIREAVCDTVASAVVLFDQCQMRPLPQNLRIEIIDVIIDNCVGAYHCAENWIEVLSPNAIASAIPPESIYVDLPALAYFESVLVHEMAHAAYDGVFCPFETCVATNEYVAYTMQFRSMEPHLRARLEEAAPMDRAIHPDEINAMVLFMAPDVFALKAWRHHLQQDDPCSFIGQVMGGEYYFDVHMP